MKDGKDPEFNRSFTKSMIPLEEGPFYGIAQWPAVHHTMGGLRINTKARFWISGPTQSRASTRQARSPEESTARTGWAEMRRLKPPCLDALQDECSQGKAVGLVRGWPHRTVRPGHKQAAASPAACAATKGGNSGEWSPTLNRLQTMRMAKLRSTSLIALALLCLAFSPASPAQTSESTKPADGCAACHKDFSSVLPQQHPAINSAALASCFGCHAIGQAGEGRRRTDFQLASIWPMRVRSFIWSASPAIAMNLPLQKEL